MVTADVGTTLLVKPTCRFEAFNGRISGQGYAAGCKGVVRKR